MLPEKYSLPNVANTAVRLLTLTVVTVLALAATLPTLATNPKNPASTTFFAHFITVQPMFIKLIHSDQNGRSIAV